MRSNGFYAGGLMLALALLAGGCHRGMGPASDRVQALSQLPYPKDAPLGDDLDIIAVRKGGTLQLANRTPQAYHHVQIWLNRQYVSEVTDVAIGVDNHYSLHDFVNMHRETFPVGTLLAPDKAKPVVLAEMFDPSTGKRYRMTVQLKQQRG